MSAAAPEPRANMGAPEPRIDGRLKVSGEARYPSDVAVENPAYAFLLTSAIARGRITGMDLSGAEAVPGLLAVLTHENTGELKKVGYSFTSGGASTSIQELGPEIFHDGQIVAMAVAETFEAAREAAQAIRVSYEEEPPAAVFDADGVAMEPAGKGRKGWLMAGDADAAVAQAEVSLEADYETPPQHHNAIELFTTTCLWEGGRLTVLEPSQFVYGLRRSVAERLGMADEDVRVISRFVGGAFGSKAQMTPRTCLVALAAKRLGRPVKLAAARDQGFTIATYRAETRHRVKLGARRDGRLTGYVHEGFELTSRPDSYSVGGTEDTARLYGFGSVRTSVHVVHADRATPGFMRSPPVVPYMYALESAMDELAVKLGIDPVELRRINDTTTDVTGKSYSSRSLMACYDEAAAVFGWAHRTPRPGSMQDGDWLVGWGCASAMYPTHTAAATARLRLEADGTLLVQTASHDLGTGAYTVLGQTAAEALGIPMARVRVELGDTSLPAAPTAGGSNNTASVCSAILQAAEGVRTKLQQAGGEMADLPAAFARLGTDSIEETAEFIPKGAGPDSIKALREGRSTLTGGSRGEKLVYALGAEFVEVRVHRLTREVRATRAVGAFAGGRVVNTRTAHSQLMGGMIWGIGSALHEAAEIDTRLGRTVNDNLAEYLVPVNADIGQIEVIMVPEEDTYVNPAGVKGLGELANVGTAAAVTNAVYHATGVRIRDLPVRIEKLL